MKRYFLITSLFLLVSACEFVSEHRVDEELMMVPAELSTVPDSVKSAYRIDAARLALRYRMETSDPQALPVEISERDTDAFYRALLHVYHSESAARDTVVSVYRIRTFPRPALFQLIVSFDQTLPWTQAWRDEHRLTGYEPIDRIMEQYGLQLERYYPWSFGHAVVLSSPEPVNLEALAALFAPIDGIRYAEPNGFVGDGNDIRAEWKGDHFLLDYSIGFGDCPAGCTGRRHWVFGINTKGHVTFVGSHGSPPPENHWPGW